MDDFVGYLRADLSNRSHGFRPNRSCHTALLQLQRNFSGVKWFIEGDIKSFFDNIDHAVLIGILRGRIHDEYFIALIWKFLKIGYLEDWTFHRTYSGTPQGSIISPILSNIYLNELDRFMERYMESLGTKKNVRNTFPTGNCKSRRGGFDGNLQSTQGTDWLHHKSACSLSQRIEDIPEIDG